MDILSLLHQFLYISQAYQRKEGFLLHPDNAGWSDCIFHSRLLQVSCRVLLFFQNHYAFIMLLSACGYGCSKACCSCTYDTNIQHLNSFLSVIQFLNIFLFYHKKSLNTTLLQLNHTVFNVIIGKIVYNK